MLNAIALLVVGMLALRYFLKLRSDARPHAPYGESRLIARASRGDQAALKALEDVIERESVALRSQAATDRKVALRFLEQKQQQLQALQWAETALEAKAGSHSMAESEKDALARIEVKIREVASDIEWARERSTL